MPLVEASASVYVVVDAQPGFVEHDAMSEETKARCRATLVRIAWLAHIAGRLEVPTVVVEEGPEREGPTHEEVGRRLAPGTPVIPKPTFGLCDCEAAVAAIDATGRSIVVIAGYETDTCVAQSAVGLVDRGYRVVMPEDATYSASEFEHRRGMERARAGGAEPNSCKGVTFEWLKHVGRAQAVMGAAREEFGGYPFQDPT